jgi:hypothetical protein
MRELGLWAHVAAMMVAFAALPRPTQVARAREALRGWRGWLQDCVLWALLLWLMVAKPDG